jgi:hypothetical protein
MQVRQAASCRPVSMVVLHELLYLLDGFRLQPLMANGRPSAIDAGSWQVLSKLVRSHFFGTQPRDQNAELLGYSGACTYRASPAASGGDAYKCSVDWYKLELTPPFVHSALASSVIVLNLEVVT